MGLAQNLIVNLANSSFLLIYSGPVRGWVLDTYLQNFSPTPITSQSEIFNISTITDNVTVSWTINDPLRVIAILNNTHPVYTVHYTIAGSTLTFVDDLEPGDRLWVREI